MGGTEKRQRGSEEQGGATAVYTEAGRITDIHKWKEWTRTFQVAWTARGEAQRWGRRKSSATSKVLTIPDQGFVYEEVDSWV